MSELHGSEHADFASNPAWCSPFPFLLSLNVSRENPKITSALTPFPPTSGLLGYPSSNSPKDAIHTHLRRIPTCLPNCKLSFMVHHQRCQTDTRISLRTLWRVGECAGLTVDAEMRDCLPPCSSFNFCRSTVSERSQKPVPPMLNSSNIPGCLKMLLEKSTW